MKKKKRKKREWVFNRHPWGPWGLWGPWGGGLGGQRVTDPNLPTRTHKTHQNPPERTRTHVKAIACPVILYLQKQSEDSEIRYLRKQTEAVKDKDY